MKRIITLSLLITIIFIIIIYHNNYNNKKFEQYKLKDLVVRIPAQINWDINEFKECSFTISEDYVDCLFIEKDDYEIVIVDYGDIEKNETLWLSREEYNDTTKVKISNLEFIRPNYRLNINKDNPSYISFILYKQEYWSDYMIATSYLKYDKGIFRILYKIPLKDISNDKIQNYYITEMDKILETLEFI